jgi:hypothetical protein
MAANAPVRPSISEPSESERGRDDIRKDGEKRAEEKKVVVRVEEVSDLTCLPQRVMGQHQRDPERGETRRACLLLRWRNPDAVAVDHRNLSMNVSQRRRDTKEN